MNLIESNTLDPEAPLDDLEPLRELVGDARVVAIGEASHHVSEFYLLRHRLLRFLVERCGFTAYALETQYADGQLIDAWVQGGAGTVEDVAARGIDNSMGECREMHDTLTWIREHNRTAEHPVRFTGCLGGSPRAAVGAVLAYLREADPDALPLAQRAFRLAGGERDVPTMKIIADYGRLAPGAQDELSALISRLVVRLETMTDYQRAQGRAVEHTRALHQVRDAWYLDNAIRDFNGRGLAVGSACMEAAGFDIVRRLLGDGRRVVLATHNTHIRRTIVEHEGDFGLFPQGNHLARLLGADYVSIAATSGGGRTATGQVAPDHPLGMETVDTALPPLPDDAIETAFDTDAALAIADLRGEDAERHQRIRMLDYFMELPVTRAFDAVAYVPTTRSIAGIEART